MNYIWAGVGGGIVGFVIGFLFGRHKKKVKLPDTTEQFDAEENEVQEPEEEEDNEERYMASQYGYWRDIEDEEKDEIEDDVEDYVVSMNAYLASTESPTEDDEEDEEASDDEHTDMPGHFIESDEYYTHDGDIAKKTLWYHSDTDTFCDHRGDDFTNDLERSGIVMSEVLMKLSNDDVVFWRDPQISVDYKIQLDEGE